MKLYYVIKATSDKSYVSIYDDRFSKHINEAMEFESEQQAIEYSERNFDYYFKFTIEKIYEITK